jgi:hypothetical protein
MALTVLLLLGVVDVYVGVLARGDVSVGRTLDRDLAERDVYAQLCARDRRDTPLEPRRTGDRGGAGRHAGLGSRDAAGGG